MTQTAPPPTTGEPLLSAGPRHSTLIVLSAALTWTAARPPSFAARLVHHRPADRRRAEGLADALLGELAADPAGLRGVQQVADAALAHDEHRAADQDRLSRAEVEVVVVVVRPRGRREEGEPLQARAELGDRVAAVVRVPAPDAPFPTETHRLPSGPVTGPPGAQMAPSRLVGVRQLGQRPVAGERRADDASLVGAAVSGQPAEGGVDPPVVDRQPGPLLVEGGLVRVRRDVEGAVAA